MRKRDRTTESSSRFISCYYCPPNAPTVAFNTLTRHTERLHESAKLFPPRTKDAVPLSDFFARKRLKTEESQKMSTLEPSGSANKTSEVSDAAPLENTSDQNTWYAKFFASE